jgi:hypothetical protein
VRDNVAISRVHSFALARSCAPAREKASAMVNFVVVVVVVVVVVARGRHGAARRRLWRALSVPSTVVEGERTFFNWRCEARVHVTEALAMCIVCACVCCVRIA